MSQIEGSTVLDIRDLVAATLKTDTDIPSVVVPDGFDVKSLESLQIAPSRIRQITNLISPGSLIAEFCRTVGEPIHVPLMLTHKLSLKTRQQFFSDINNNVSKPSAAINMAYNGRDKNAQEMVSFISSHSVFSEITDFEHNVVPAKSDKWVSFKALSDATAKFSGSCSQDDLEGLWNAWLMLTGLDDIRRGTNQAEYKREYIQFHAVMINAFGYAVQRLSEGRGVRGVTLMIEDLVMNTGIADREDFFLISSWDGICASCEKTRPTVIANVSSQKAAASRLIDAIVNKNLSVSSGKEASHD